ncbi:hypothetical protein, partial [Klebsiella pneumoniae]|uniref:hypothetical protein n=1 Tax=Klebsiella pneumoniae TaxID=573 RepID=UPI001F359A14
MSIVTVGFGAIDAPDCGVQFRVGSDEIPDAVFARSNMFWDEYKVAWQMSLPGGYDGVALDYVDPLTNKK